MKQSTIKGALLLTIALFSVSFFHAIANNTMAAQMDQTPILIRQQSTNQPSAPRTPAFNPFFAQLEDTHVLLGCTSPYGVVDVTLVSTAGDNYNTDFDTEDWTIIIPVSGNTGHYTLTLLTESGTVFVGEFDM